MNYAEKSVVGAGKRVGYGRAKHVAHVHQCQQGHGVHDEEMVKDPQAIGYEKVCPCLLFTEGYESL